MRSHFGEKEVGMRSLRRCSLVLTTSIKTFFVRLCCPQEFTPNLSTLIFIFSRETELPFIQRILRGPQLQRADPGISPSRLRSSTHSLAAEGEKGTVTTSTRVSAIYHLHAAVEK